SSHRARDPCASRPSTTIMAILGKVIEQNDKPRAEIVFDVEILEVDRHRAKTYGLNPSEYALGGICSPEVSPTSTTTTNTGTGTNVGTGNGTVTTTTSTGG